jgi:DNA-binding LytR/AlgR family response regulator
MSKLKDRMLVWTDLGRAVVLEPDDVYWLEAEGHLSWVRRRSWERLKVRRRLGELIETLAGFGFLRIHRNHAVNLRRVAEVRRRTPGGDWEVKLEPPVNRVLPVARGLEEKIARCFRREEAAITDRGVDTGQKPTILILERSACMT